MLLSNSRFLVISILFEKALSQSWFKQKVGKQKRNNIKALLNENLHLQTNGII
jgi:hypothetical protein